MLGTVYPPQHGVTSQITWSSALLLWQYPLSPVNQTKQSFLKFSDTALTETRCLTRLSCIHAQICLLAVVMIALQVFSPVSVLCGQLLCFFHDHDDFLANKAATSPIIIFKACCEKAKDYTKRKHVFRWCVWIVWLLAVCQSIKSGYFHLLHPLMWASDSHCYCVHCTVPQAVGH
jgi:hypothetical protein